MLIRVRVARRMAEATLQTMGFGPVRARSRAGYRFTQDWTELYLVDDREWSSAWQADGNPYRHADRLEMILADAHMLGVDGKIARYGGLDVELLGEEEGTRIVARDAVEQGQVDLAISVLAADPMGDFVRLLVPGLPLPDRMPSIIGLAKAGLPLSRHQIADEFGLELDPAPDHRTDSAMFGREYLGEWTRAEPSDRERAAEIARTTPMSPSEALAWVRERRRAGLPT